MTPEVEACPNRLGNAADKLFEALEEIEASGGLRAALDDLRPGSRRSLVDRLRSTQGLLADAMRPRRRPVTPSPELK
jgi:hypothetical protein